MCPGYYTSAERDDETDVAESLCDRFIQGPACRSMPGDARFWATRPHVLIFFPEIGMDKLSAQLAAQRLRGSSIAPPGDTLSPVDFRQLIYFPQQRSHGKPRGAAAHYSETAHPAFRNLSIYYEPADVPPISIDRAELGPALRMRWSIGVVSHCQNICRNSTEFFARIAAEVPDSQFTFIEFGGG